MDSRHIRNKQIISQLQSGDIDAVRNALEEIRLFGNAEILPYLLVFIFNTNSEEFRSSGYQVLNDIKDTEAVPVLVNALHTFRGKEGFHKLVSSCWQNGMDFSSYIRLFADLVIEEDFTTAIEAYSVIEENINQLEITEIQYLTDLFKECVISEKDEYRKNLIHSLVEMLETTANNY